MDEDGDVVIGGVGGGTSKQKTTIDFLAEEEEIE
jgi:predicted alternative tryptophan synthase beta-subunit